MRNSKYCNLRGYAPHGFVLSLFTITALAAACFMLLTMTVSKPYCEKISETDKISSDKTSELVMPETPEGTSPIINSVDRKSNFYTCILAGMDKDETRTDTIIMVSLDLETGKISLLNIPRDTRSYMKNGKVHKINAAHNKGVDRMLEEIKNTVGFYPDNYVIINYSVFEELIDTIGGVEIEVDNDMYYEDPDQDLHIDIKKGKQILDGENALEYMRFRSGYADEDLGRIRAQQKMYKAVAKKMMNPSSILLVTKLAQIVNGNVETDVGWSQMLWLGTKVFGLDFENVTTYTLPGKAVAADYAANPKETLELVNEHFNPYKKDIEKLKIAK